MQPKTSTTLGKLQVGDRFYFGKDKKVYMVCSQLGTQAEINHPPPLELKYPTLKSKETPVVFLRHATPEENAAK